MVEIIIMIAVVGWFWRTARANGQNGVGFGVMWALIGALSYYVPVLVFGIYIFPPLLKPFVTPDNYGMMVVLAILLNVAAGAGCCFLASRVLVSRVGASA